MTNAHLPLPAPQEIDFLPASFHQGRERRKIKLWRSAILGIALALSMLGGAQQYYHNRELAATRTNLEQHVLDSFAQLQGADVKRRRIESLEAQANLVTQLRLCVPPTRLLSAVTDCLPEYVSLTEFRVERNRISATSSKRTRTEQPQSSDAAAEHKSAAELDLEQLLRDRSQTALSVSLTGVAPDDQSVSGYLAALKQTGLFDDIQPLYTDESEFRELPLRRFSVRLSVRRVGVGVVAEPQNDASGPVAASQPRSQRSAARQTLRASRSLLRRGT